MENIKSVVHQVLRNMSGSAPTPERFEQWLMDQWTAEEKLHIKLIGIKENTAAFYVDSPAWMQYFENNKSQLLKKLQTFQPNISNIRFKLGKIT